MSKDISKTIKLPRNIMKTKYVYVTKSVNADMTAYEGFKYPDSGSVEVSDWEATKVCGNGLHGFLWGEGRGDLANFRSDKWLLIRVNPQDGLVVMEGKCKFRKGEVIAVGDYKSIAKELTKYLPKDRVYKVIGLTQETGDNGMSVVGYRGIAISGDSGHSTSGDDGHSTSGWCGTSTSGDSGQSTSGDSGQSTSGSCGTSTSGDCGTSKSGDNGQSTSGAGGTSTSGYRGTSTSGAYGTSTSGYEGHSTSGVDGIIIIDYWDEVQDKYLRKVGHIGEAGLKPNTKYKLDSKHNFMEV